VFILGKGINDCPGVSHGKMNRPIRYAPAFGISWIDSPFCSMLEQLVMR